MAVKRMIANPGRYTEITLLEKAAGSKLIYAKKSSLPLGLGGFRVLRSQTATLFQLLRAKLTHNGVTYKKIVVWQPLRFGHYPPGAEGEMAQAP